MSNWEDGPLSGRRPRVSSDAARNRENQVKEQMLDKAQQMVEENGLSVSLGHIRFEDIIQATGVSRTAAYRAWETKDEFLAKLLLRLAGETSPGEAAFDVETLKMATAVAHEHRDELDTREGRYRTIVEVCRRAARQNYDAIVGSPKWKTYVALIATMESNANRDIGKQLRDSLEHTEWKFVNRMTGFYQTMAAILGYRLRDGIHGGYQSAAQMCAALVEGLALLDKVMPNIPAPHIADPFGVGEAEWSMPSIGFFALLMGLVEEVPEDEYDADAARAGLDQYLAALGITGTAGPDQDQ